MMYFHTKCRLLGRVCVSVPLILALALMMSCRDKYGSEYDRVKNELNSLEGRVDKITDNLTKQEIKDIIERTESLVFEYDSNEVRSDEARLLYEKLCSELADGKNSIPDRLEKVLIGQSLVLKSEQDYLMEGMEAVNLHVSKGDTIRIGMKFEKSADIKLFNADSKKLLKSYMGKQSLSESIIAPNTAIYVVEINPKGTQYADLSVSVAVSSLNQFLNYKTVTYELVQCGKNDFRAVPVAAIKTRPIFEEPRRHTLRSSLKAAFTGGDRALVAVEVPTGTSDLLYSLRISTSQTDRETDGKFKPNTDMSYRKIRFLGLPIYDSSRSNGIISMILDDNVPYREEEAYCNMYIFYNAAQAKKFQDGNGKISELSYDVTNSRVGTQSCNGRINVKGKSVLYFGFLNERMRFQNYIWFEVLASSNTTDYYNAKYSLVDPEISK